MRTERGVGREALAAFSRASATYDEAAVVQRDVALALSAMLEGYLHRGDKILEIGCGTGALSELLAERVGADGLTLNDLSAEMMQECLKKVGGKGASMPCALVGDAERLDWPKGQDGVVSSSAVQWFDSPFSFLDKAYGAVREGGLVALATYGPMTFMELRGGRIDEETYRTAEQWHEAADGLFESIVSERRVVVQSFESRMSMLRSIVLSGVGGSRRTAQSAGQVSADGWMLTYEVLFFVWRRRREGRSAS